MHRVFVLVVHMEHKLRSFVPGLHCAWVPISQYLRISRQQPNIAQATLRFLIFLRTLAEFATRSKICQLLPSCIDSRFPLDICVFCVPAKLLYMFCTSASRFVETRRCACSTQMASVQPFWWNFTEKEITLRVWEYSAPHVDTWRGWELRRLFGHVHGTADVVNVLKNEKRMMVDLIERVEGGHLGTRRILLKRCHTSCATSTRFAPVAFFRCSVAFWVRCRNARSSKARGVLQSVLVLRMTEDQLARFALHAPPDEILALCDRRGHDAFCLHMAECVQQAFNDLGDPTPNVLAMIFA